MSFPERSDRLDSDHEGQGVLGTASILDIELGSLSLFRLIIGVVCHGKWFNCMSIDAVQAVVDQTPVHFDCGSGCPKNVMKR